MVASQSHNEAGSRRQLKLTALESGGRSEARPSGAAAELVAAPIHPKAMPVILTTLEELTYG